MKMKKDSDGEVDGRGDWVGVEERLEIGEEEQGSGDGEGEEEGVDIDDDGDNDDELGLCTSSSVENCFCE